MQLNFAGQSGLYWFIGVVEDNMDPLKSGRVRVRCFGIHTEDLTKIPTDTLPWALVGVSTNSSSSDIGTMVIGTVVYGRFLDSQEMQLPLVEGIIPGLHINTNTNVGFNNFKENPPTKGTYTGNPYVRISNIPDRVYYNDTKSANNITISEPKNTRKPSYPHNIATMSDSGHVIERDDTPGNERLSLQHKNGSYLEFNQNGDGVMKVVKDLYNLCVNNYQHIKNMRAVTVANGDYLKVDAGDKIIEVDGGKYILKAQGSEITITGECNLTVNGNCNATINGNKNETINGNCNVKVSGTYVVNSSSTNLVSSGVTVIDGASILIG